jgi:hypothetical protein
MKKFLTLFIVLFFASASFAFIGAPPPPSTGLKTYTVATAPAASANTNMAIIITDGNTATDCETTGTGTTRNICVSDGTNWLIAGDGATGVLTAYTVGTLPGTPSDGDTAVVTDGNDAADCTVGTGSNLNVCIYDTGGGAWVIAGDGAGSGNAFTTHDAPAGTDPVASGAGTLTWDDTAPITITGNSTTDTLTVAITDATTSAKGAASFSSSHFSVSSGAVSVTANGVDDTLIDWGTGANQVSGADFANEDVGDISIASGSWTLDEDTVDVTALKDDAAPTDEDILTYEATGTTLSYMSIDEVAGAISEGALTDSSVVSADIKCRHQRRYNRLCGLRWGVDRR